MADAAAEAGAQPVRPSAGARRPDGSAEETARRPVGGDTRPATEAQSKMVYAKLKAAGVDDVEAALFAAVGKRDTRELTRGDVDAILNRLAKGPPPVTPTAPPGDAGPPPASPPSDVPAPDLEAEQARYAAQQAEAGVDVDSIPF